MAVGKSAIGRTLAKKLRRRFVDLDRVIERAEGSKVREIFEHKGEAYFRQLEKQALADVLEENNQVIATGGSHSRRSKSPDTPRKGAPNRLVRRDGCVACESR